jgi:hypothetical protein
VVASVACTLLEQQTLFDPTCEVWDDALPGFSQAAGKGTTQARAVRVILHGPFGNSRHLSKQCARRAESMTMARRIGEVSR